MDRLELATQRAEEARRLLDSPIFAKAFADTRHAMLEALAEVPNLKDERANELHRMVKCLDRVKRCIEVHVETGKLAQKEIQGRGRIASIFNR